MNQWNLDALYPSVDSEAFQHDFDDIDRQIAGLNELADSLEQDSPASTLRKVILALSDYQTLTRKIGAYLSLRQSANTTDQQIVSINSRFQNKISQSARATTRFSQWIARQDIEALIGTDPLLSQHAFWLRETQARAAHTLSDEVEEAIGKMELNASSAWSQLQEYMTSTVSVTLQGEPMTLSAIRNLAYSPEAQVRKDAYQAELKAYDQIKDARGYAKKADQADGYTVTLAVFGKIQFVHLVMSKPVSLQPGTAYRVTGMGYDMRDHFYVKADGHISNY